MVEGRIVTTQIQTTTPILTLTNTNRLLSKEECPHVCKHQTADRRPSSEDMATCATMHTEQRGRPHQRTNLAGPRTASLKAARWEAE